MKRHYLFSGFFVLALPVSFVNADTSSVDIFKTFRSVAALEITQIKVPTIVDVALPPDFSYRRSVAVFNKTSGVFEPNLIVSSTEKAAPQAVDYQNAPGVSSTALTDGVYDTYEDFDLPEEGNGKVSIAYIYKDSIRSSSLYFALDRYVALPNSITVKAEINGVEKTVLSNYRPFSNTIVFPENASKKWTIEFVYSQPLRISELEIQDLSNAKTSDSLRFLAKPENEYEIYLDPEVIIPIPTKESPNLGDTQGIKRASISKSILPNKYYKEADSDSDGIPDIKDNCVRLANSDQIDVDQNGRGDACDDFDRDGAVNSLDNCINDPNYNQADIDNDTIGDVCDSEESRVTERYPWIVWGGIIFAGLVFIGLLALVATRIRKGGQTE